MERFAGGANVMLATGGAPNPPSSQNRAISWIFSTTMSENELQSCVADRSNWSRPTARLITACRQDPEKGTDIVIQSLRLILQEFPGATLDVVGDGSALSDLRILATRLGVSESVNFHGKVDHEAVLRLLQQADLFCYPTATEGFPKIVLEALACGLPVITTPVSVLPELIGDRCGILLEERTAAAVAQAAVRILSDHAGYQSMCVRASATAKQYSLERWRDTIGELLRTEWVQLRSDA
jgi:glycosyltransferase involved in cell wall biosynthesis